MSSDSFNNSVLFFYPAGQNDGPNSCSDPSAFVNFSRCAGSNIRSTKGRGLMSENLHGGVNNTEKTKLLLYGTCLGLLTFFGLSTNVHITLLVSDVKGNIVKQPEHT